MRLLLYFQSFIQSYLQSYVLQTSFLLCETIVSCFSRGYLLYFLYHTSSSLLFCLSLSLSLSQPLFSLFLFFSFCNDEIKIIKFTLYPLHTSILLIHPVGRKFFFFKKKQSNFQVCTLYIANDVCALTINSIRALMLRRLIGKINILFAIS